MKGLFTLCILSLAFLSLPGPASELPVESFSRLPQFQKTKISPDGKHVAFIENISATGQSVLSSFDLEKGVKRPLVNSDNESIKINWYKWANNKTLLISGIFADFRGRVKTTETRLFAVEADGSDKNTRVLIKPRAGSLGGEHLSQFQDNVVDLLPDDNDHILVAIDLDKPNQPSVYKLNIYSNKKSRIFKGKRMIRSFMTDQQSRLRLAKSVSYKTGVTKILVRAKEGSNWETLFEYNALEEPGITPLGFALDHDTLYYNEYYNDKKAIFKIGLKDKLKELVFSDPDYDVNGSLIYSRKTRDVIGINHSNSSNGRIYWDKDREKLQKGLDQLLPDTSNYLVHFSQDQNRYILYTENDFTPGKYYFGDRKNQQLAQLFEQYPELVPSVLTKHKLVTYTARDGTLIEGYLTLPKGLKAPIPTILHPHGGPGARDHSGFDYWTSFFTNRGYAVFRPNFRGSSGYGYEFAKSQMKSWGMEMQDDLTDATQWLIDEKIADPEKICVVGASYGGYAALMATVKTPELFKCAVSFAGVSNLKKLVVKSRRYLGSKFVKNQIGDDYDDLEARSPYYSVEKITAPILVIHGEQDRVVDVEQSKIMVDELQDQNKQVEYIELENGDHYLSIQRNRHLAFNAIDKFLRKHLN